MPSITTIPPCTGHDLKGVAETSGELRIGQRNLRDGANKGRYPYHRHGNRLLFCADCRLTITRLHSHPVTAPMPSTRRTPTVRRPRRALATV